jgi:hypothetical protein
MKRRTFRVVLSAIGLACSLLLLAATTPLHAESASTSLATAYNNRSDPTRLIASYYDAINSGDFARAYEYWESAPNGGRIVGTVRARLYQHQKRSIFAHAANQHARRSRQRLR